MIRNLEELGPNLQKICSRLYANQSLLKLLYYTNKDPLNEDDLSEEQIAHDVFDKLIKIVPVVKSVETSNSIVVVRVTRGRENSQNNQYVDIQLQLEVLVPNTQWFIKNSNLRPFCIMGQIQSSLNNKIINGLGRLSGGDFELNFLTDEMSCYEMTFDILEYE